MAFVKIFVADPRAFPRHLITAGMIEMFGSEAVGTNNRFEGNSGNVDLCILLCSSAFEMKVVITRSMHFAMFECSWNESSDHMITVLLSYLLGCQ